MSRSMFLDFCPFSALLICKCLIGSFGLVWFGLVWFGLVWFGLVWFGYASMTNFDFCFSVPSPDDVEDDEDLDEGE